MRLFFLCLCIAFVGCDSATSASNGPTATDSCTNLAKARCALLSSCTNGIGIQSTYGDLATCEARQTAACVTNLSASGQNQTPITVQACADVAPTQSCWDRTLNLQPAACIPPAGTIADGQPCIASGQCTSTWCVLQDNAVVGVCGPLPKAGDACDTTTCGRGLECGKNAAGTSVCFAPVASGGACDKDHRCGPNLGCVGLTKTTAGICQSRGATAGVVCDQTSKTAPDCLASFGLFCDSTGHCKAATPVKSGEGCGLVGTDIGTFCSAGICVKAAATDKSGACKGDAADGGACDSDATKGPSCLSPAKCVPSTSGGTAGICTLPVAN